MSGILLGLLAETSIHVGVGQADGAIDLPVAREGGTEHPHVPGSGVKGALREGAEDGRGMKSEATNWFGSKPDPNNPTAPGGAGEVLVGDMRLLLLPVRSLTGFYKWLTCPYLVERYRRDRARLGLAAGDTPNWPNSIMQMQDDGEDTLPTVLTGGCSPLYLEERLFAPEALPEPDKLIALLEPAIAAQADDAARRRLRSQLAVVSDADFAWFAGNALPVTAHNKLEDKTKVSENLWFEETLPPDTVLTLMLVDRSNGRGAAVEAASALFFDTGAKSYLRVGGNETVGQGWLRVCRIGIDADRGGGRPS